MVKKLKNSSVTMVGFTAPGEITKNDFEFIMLPAIVELVQRTNQLNFLLVLDAEFENFQMGAWLKEAMTRLNYMAKWNRVAVITNTRVIDSFSDLFKDITPGEFRGFNQNELQQATEWVRGQPVIGYEQVLQL